MMNVCARKERAKLSYKILSAFIAFAFSFTSVVPPSYAQSIASLNLPIPGAMVTPSQAFVPVLLKGMTIHPDDPLKFDFIIDTGNSGLDVGNGRDHSLQEESEKLVKYFLASMTIPKDDLWVNLSPYESDKIIPEALGKTELGRDMLAQDYILKQLTASLMYPEKELGKEFWEKVYKKAQEKYGTTEIPVDTFNKVWILPETATVYEHGQTVYIVEAKLKVMLDSDYVVQKLDSRYSTPDTRGPSRIENQASSIETSIIREIILPAIEKEVNEGQNFAPLRQIYHSLILAKWYKETIKNSLLSKVYVDQKKTAGVESGDETLKDQIYAQYMEAYKKGVFNYIKEDYDRLSNEVIPRKYFSGGEELTRIPLVHLPRNSASPIKDSDSPKFRAKVNIVGKKLKEVSKQAVALGQAVVLATALCVGAGCSVGVEKNKFSEASIRENIDQLYMADPDSAHNSSAFHFILDAGERAVPILIEVLQDPEAYTDARKWAAHLLGMVGDYEVVYPVLMSVLKNENNDYEWWHLAEAENGLEHLLWRQAHPFDKAVESLNAEDALGRQALLGIVMFMDPERAIDVFIELLGKDENPDVRADVAFIAHKKMVRPIMQAALNDSDREVRRNAVEALGNIGGKEVVDLLIQIVTNDGNDLVRAEAIFSLGKIGDGTILDLMKDRALNDPGWWTRRSAVQVLGDLGDIQLEDFLIQIFINDPDSWVRSVAAEALGKIKSLKSVDILIENLSQNSWYQENIIWSLGEIGDSRAVEVLVQILRPGSADYIKQTTIEALGKLGDARAVTSLLTMTNNSDMSVRWAAVKSLAMIEDQRAVDYIVKFLAGGAQGQFANDYIYGLGTDTVLNVLADRKNVLIIDRFIDLLGSSSDEDTRRKSAYFLGSIGSERAVDALVNSLMHDSSAVVRIFTAEALGKIGDARALDALLLAFKNDNSEGTRETSAKALGLIGGEAAFNALIEALLDDQVENWKKDYIVESLALLGDAKAVDYLIPLINDESLDIYAIQALGAIGDPRAVDPITQHLSALADTEWLHAWERETAVAALGQIGDVRSVEIIIKFLLNDSDISVRSAAARVLGKIGDETSIPFLKQTMLWAGKNYDAEILADWLYVDAYVAIQSILRKSVSDVEASSPKERNLSRKGILPDFSGQSSSPITPQEARALIKGKLAPEHHHLISDTHVQLAMAYEGDFEVVYHAGPPERIEIIRGEKLGQSSSPVGESRQSSVISHQLLDERESLTTEDGGLTTNPGGIDMNAIDLDREGAGVDIQFDPAQLQDIIDAGIDGFAPVIINITPLPSVLPLLGLEPVIKEEPLELSSSG